MQPDTHQSIGRFVRPLINPAVFDFWAARINASWSWQRPLARIVERRTEARDTVSLVLQPNRHFAGCRPGQHIPVSAEIDGRRITRSYSPTSVGQPRGRIAITVRQVEGGRLSTHLCRHAAVGDVLELGAAFGDMTLPANPAGRWLFLAAGSGITPLISLTRDLAAREMPAQLTLAYWVRDDADLCFADELQALAASAPAFRLQLIRTRQPHSAGGAPAGRINAELLASLAPDLADSRVFACGPRGFVDTARELAAPQAAYFLGEAFTPPPESDATGTVRLTLNASRRTLEIPSGQNLLDALEAQGVQPAYGCRMGICKTCVCGKPAGTTQDLDTGERNAEPDAALRLCVSRACTDLTLDL